MMPRPAYVVEAVDHTLAAVILLTERESVRLSELAEELGVGRATAHRLLRMLVYREFAMQQPNRSYSAGPVLRVARQRNRVEHLRSWLRPSLHEARESLQEAVHLQVLSGADVLTLESVERYPRHGDARRAIRIPALRASAGAVLLAQMSPKAVRARFTDLSPTSLAQLDRLLVTTRRQGFGMMVGSAGPDVVSLSIPVFDRDDQAVAAITCTGPASRLTRARVAETVEVLQAAADAARTALNAAPSPVSTGASAPAVNPYDASLPSGTATMYSRTG